MKQPGMARFHFLQNFDVPNSEKATLVFIPGLGRVVLMWIKLHDLQAGASGKGRFLDCP
jgi:hypothetical protein